MMFRENDWLIKFVYLFQSGVGNSGKSEGCFDFGVPDSSVRPPIGSHDHLKENRYAQDTASNSKDYEEHDIILERVRFSICFA